MGRFGKPIIVEWVAGKAGCRADGDEPFQIKLIQHEGISLCINPPAFDVDKTEIFFSISNLHPKALGLGDGGITLAAHNYVQICANLKATAPVRGLEHLCDDDSFKNTRDVMIDTLENAKLKAQFQPIPEPSRANATIAIEMKRLWAPDFVFVVPVSESSSVTLRVG